MALDHGLMRCHSYRRSSTMIDVGPEVVRRGSCFRPIDDLLRRRFGIELPAKGKG